MSDFKNLITDEERAVLAEIKRLAPIMKNKHFSFGRDWDKLVKLLDKLGTNDKL